MPIQSTHRRDPGQPRGLSLLRPRCSPSPDLDTVQRLAQRALRSFDVRPAIDTKADLAALLSALGMPDAAVPSLDTPAPRHVVARALGRVASCRCRPCVARRVRR
jgi:hypothetical protein